MNLQPLDLYMRYIPRTQQKIEIVSADDELLRGSERRQIIASACTHQRYAFGYAPRMRKNRSPKALKRDPAVKVVLKILGYLPAGKWPMSRQKEQTNRGQYQNRNAGDREASPVSPVKRLILPRSGLFGDGCVTLRH